MDSSYRDHFDAAAGFVSEYGSISMSSYENLPRYVTEGSMWGVNDASQPRWLDLPIEWLNQQKGRMGGGGKPLDDCISRGNVTVKTTTFLVRNTGDAYARTVHLRTEWNQTLPYFIDWSDNDIDVLPHEQRRIILTTRSHAKQASHPKLSWSGANIPAGSLAVFS